MIIAVSFGLCVLFLMLLLVVTGPARFLSACLRLCICYYPPNGVATLPRVIALSYLVVSFHRAMSML